MNNTCKTIACGLAVMALSAPAAAQDEVVWNDDAVGAFLSEGAALEMACEMPDFGDSGVNLQEDCYRGLVSALNRRASPEPVRVAIRRPAPRAANVTPTNRAPMGAGAPVATVPAHCVPVEDNRLDLCTTFALGSAELNRYAREQIGVFARRIVADGITTPLVIEGHTDVTGADVRNEELSLQRARAVVDYMVELGVPESQLTAAGYGSRRLRQELQNPSDSRHRRVEIVRPQQTASAD